MPTLRLAVPASTEPFARLLAGAGALQALTLELVRARRLNPDLIRREEEPYRRAGDAGDALVTGSRRRRTSTAALRGGPNGRV